jgi:hypothetical protein
VELGLLPLELLERAEAGLRAHEHGRLEGAERDVLGPRGERADPAGPTSQIRDRGLDLGRRPLPDLPERGGVAVVGVGLGHLEVVRDVVLRPRRDGEEQQQQHAPASFEFSAR